jgi:hypothetical protein
LIFFLDDGSLFSIGDDDDENDEDDTPPADLATVTHLKCKALLGNAKSLLTAKAISL